ncbi:MAG: 3-hydroxyacyl-CoA dehydrogenase [Thermaerobacter sp.]|nr:3-hydroxyacyl-CoA dehydrogenase [Thermaerobacter sp.]
MELADKVFLITGGGSGLGAAVARMCVESGAKVVIADRRRDTGQALASAVGGLFVETDVTDDEQMRAAVAAGVDTFGTLNGLVNCAGIAIASRVLGKTGPHPLAAFTQVLMVNLVGSFNAIRLTAAAMKENAPGPDGERGVIVNTASVAAFDGQIGQAAYSASKGGVVGMTLPIARELARFGIRVVTIAPGIFDTPMLAELPEPARQSLGQQVPFPQRLGQPQEYAQLVKHIVQNVMLNGEVIRLDGAIRMAPK